MSGHSKWSKNKHIKAAADKKRSNAFTKLSRNISIAARKGKDPAMNYALRTAVDIARAASMPKDNIEKAILRGAGELEGEILEEITYEGYGPNGVAILIRCITDNKNRTSSYIRSTLTKYGGNLGGQNSVAYLFKTEKPMYEVALDDIGKEKLAALLEELEDSDDVNNIKTNAQE
jgi:YebC/PmpR family DNA-binding regulatory protein